MTITPATVRFAAFSSQVRRTSGVVRVVAALLGALALLLGATSIARADTPLPPLRNLQTSVAEAAAKHQPLIVMFSLPSCPYCEKLRRTQYQFLVKQGYVVRQVEINDRSRIVGFNGQPTSGARLAVQYDVHLAPTVLFFGPGGKEIAPRIVGALTEDFYGAYLDRALHTAEQALRHGSAAS